MPVRRASAITTVVSATSEPTERSMPPWTITNVMPTAATATTTVWRVIVSRFTTPRNVSGASTPNVA